MSSPEPPSAPISSAPTAARRTRRRWWLPAGLLVGIIAWYAVVRVCSPWNAIRVVALETSSGTEALAPPDTLRIACYNIAHGRGRGEVNFNGESLEVRDRRLAEIAEFLRDADLDIVVLNEVDFDAAWSGGVNQAENIARRAGFSYWMEQRNFDCAVPFFSLRFGNAILSRHPIVEARLVDLPGDAVWESLLAGKKNGSSATVKLPGGELVRVFAVHFSYRNEAVRIGSARSIIAEAERSDIPMIVAGDFNSSPAHYPIPDPSGTSAFETILKSGRWEAIVPQDPQPPDFTFSSTKPDRAIDWILAPPAWQLLSRQVFPIQLSDHRPVVGVLRRKK